MNIQEILVTTNYVETINKFDNLINELLYSNDNGYINFTSKDALDNAQKVIDKFNYESDKISKESKIDNVDSIIASKRDELITEVKRHYEKEIRNWAYSTFDDAINNCILKASIYSDDKEKINSITGNILGNVCWISAIYDFAEEEKQNILNNINKRLDFAIKSHDADYIEKPAPNISDCETYLKIRDLIKTNLNQFLNLDLGQFKFKLSSKDVAYLNRLKNLLKTNQNTAVDEINLIDYSVELSGIKETENRYNLISEIQDDILSIENDTEQEKVKIIKRRIAIFKDKDSYYKKLFCL